MDKICYNCGKPMSELEKGLLECEHCGWTDEWIPSDETINEIAIDAGYEPPKAPPQVNNRGLSFEIFVYEDGTSAIDYYWAISETNRVYDGRTYNDKEETSDLLSHKLFRRHWEAAKSVEPPTLKGD